jgi:glycosyltransferase involved in cell wall biosynthesis
MTIQHGFVCWQPVLTDHQAYTFQALAKKTDKTIVAYVTDMEDLTRKKQGWSDLTVNSIERKLIPKRNFFYYFIRELKERRGDVHFFCSPFHRPSLMLCMLIAAWLNVEFYLISEPYSPQPVGYLNEDHAISSKVKVMARPLLYWFYSMILHRFISGVFTISKLAYEQYLAAGIQSDKLYPFGYFIPYAHHNDISLLAKPDRGNHELKIIFVGALIKRKGVDLLQQAVIEMVKKNYRVSLDLYGAGDSGLVIKNSTSIKYKGKIPFGMTQQVMAHYDVLVLPSRHDGWGVVVNEALCAGIPVVCSDTVGAAHVAASFGAGFVFTSGRIDGLEEILTRLCTDELLLNSAREAAPIAAGFLQPKDGADYIAKVIAAQPGLKSKITQPWQ